MSQTYVAPPGWQPPPARPPLTPRQKSGARLAGIVGFLVLSIGFGLFAFPLALLAFGAFFALVLEFIRRVSQNEAGFDQFMNGFAQFDPAVWILPLIIVSIIGLGVMAAALFLSSRILRSHDVARNWAVTWAGAGIAIIGSWLLSGVSAIPLGFANMFNDGDGVGSAGIGVAIGIASALISLATTAVIGWLSWWWMAHALRGPAVGSGASVAPAVAPGS